MIKMSFFGDFPSGKEKEKENLFHLFFSFFAFECQEKKILISSSSSSLTEAN